MYNRENLILEQYPFEVKQASKGRGVLICDTSMGLKILKEYRGSEGRADFLYRLLQFLAGTATLWPYWNRIVSTAVTRSRGAVPLWAIQPPFANWRTV